MRQPYTQTLEREIKLGVTRDFILPQLPGERLPSRLFTSTYFDTEGYRLARSGITLRYRIEARKGGWQLKLPHGTARLELASTGGRTSPPDSLTRLLFAHLRGLPLKPIARLRTRRTGMQVRRGNGPVADVVVDSVVALNGRRVSQHLYELEVELLEGSDKDLERIEGLLRDAGAQAGDPRPKVFQVLGLDLPVPVVPVPPAASPAEHVRALLRTQLTLLLAHDPGTRLGTDEEELHQMRVATRRLRAYLRATRPMFATDWVANVRTELAWLGSTLGPVRDLDVLLGHLEKECATLHLPERRAIERLLQALRRERAAARVLLLQALECDRYLALLDRLETGAQSSAVVDATVSLADIAGAEFKTLRRAMQESGPDASDHLLHNTRIQGKRTRYAAELAEPSVGKPATRFLRQAKVLQDLLGEHQDALVTEQRLRKLLGQARGKFTAFAVGRLVERQCERRRSVRARLANVWAKLEKRGRKAWG
jgi:CHAD domain-containing protein